MGYVCVSDCSTCSFEVGSIDSIECPFMGPMRDYDVAEMEEEEIRKKWAGRY